MANVKPLVVGPNGKTRQIQTPDVIDPAFYSSSGVSDGDKGDITVSGAGTIYTLDPDVKYGLAVTRYMFLQ